MFDASCGVFLSCSAIIGVVSNNPQSVLKVCFFYGLYSSNKHKVLLETTPTKAERKITLDS